MGRVTVFNLMALVGIVALGIGAMRDASEWTERAAFTVTLFVMASSLVGAIARKGSPGFVGFAVFSWLYAVIAFVPAARDEFRQHLLTTSVVHDTVSSLLEIPPRPKLHIMTPRGQSMEAAEEDYRLILAKAEASRALRNGLKTDPEVSALIAHERRLMNLGSRVGDSSRIAHCMFALLLGLLGAGVGRFLAWKPSRKEKQKSEESPSDTAKDGAGRESSPGDVKQQSGCSTQACGD